MADTDKDQEGIANIIEARNKYRMLRTRKERTAFITKAAKIFKYSCKYTNGLNFLLAYHLHPWETHE